MAMEVYNTLSLEEMQAAVHLALASWNDLGGSNDELLGYLLLVQASRLEQENENNPLALRRATNTVLQSGIDELAEQDEIGAKILRSRFIDGEITRQVATRIHASPDQVNRWQRLAIDSLAQILLSRELDLRQSRIQQMEAELPPSSYGRLFGFEEAIQDITGQLLKQAEPWLVAISGIGGIGKTSLADNITRQIIRRLIFDRIIWVTVSTRGIGGRLQSPEACYEQVLSTLIERLQPVSSPVEPSAERESRIRLVLQDRPHLIVLDNLETEEHTTYLLSKLRQWINPTKFLMTTRARPTVAAPAFFRSLDELSVSEAEALLRHQAETVGLSGFAQLDQSDFNAIYEITGGNPLALKLVVGLVTVLPIGQILAGLTQSRRGPIEEMYRHIYWEAWKTLSYEAQSLLQAMPLIAETGARPEQMQAISNLPDSDFWPAVSDLASRSLLEVRGTYQDRRYGIHRLTETFLRTEIIDWPEP